MPGASWAVVGRFNKNALIISTVDAILLLGVIVTFAVASIFAPPGFSMNWYASEASGYMAYIVGHTFPIFAYHL